MKRFKIGLAQNFSMKGDINENIRQHINIIKIASAHNVDYLIFPEMSLTGYYPELASKLATTTQDKRLQALSKCSIQNNISVGIGVPLISTGLPYIGLMLFIPNSPIETYQKMNLHDDEELFFKHGKNHHYFDHGEIKIANAICADTNNSAPFMQAKNAGANIYAAGVLITKEDFLDDSVVLKNDSKNDNILIAVANYDDSSD